MSQEATTSSIYDSIIPPTQDSVRKITRIAVSRSAAGAFLGLAWGAGLRAWMVILALGFGEQPHFTWKGTFGGILLPAALVGALLSGAALAARDPERKRWRWVLLSPLLLVVGPALATENFITVLVTTGMGGGAIGVALIGLLGGYAFSGLGASWLRRVSGLLALLLTLASGVGFFFSGGAKDAASNAGKAFGGLLFILLMVLLVAGVSAPFRRQAKRPVPAEGI